MFSIFHSNNGSHYKSDKNRIQSNKTVEKLIGDMKDKATDFEINYRSRHSKDCLKNLREIELIIKHLKREL